MYGLSKSTEISIPLYKTAVFKKFRLTSAQREMFDADISRMFITHVVSPKTLPNIVEGSEISAFYVVEIQLKRRNCNTKNIELLVRLIPQKMLFVLHCGDKAQLVIYHTKLICSEWKQKEEINISLTGFSFDTVWENVVKRIGNIEVEEGNTLEEQIAVDEQRAKVLAQIEVLERKMANEKQPRRKREYFEQIKQLKTRVL